MSAATVYRPSNVNRCRRTKTELGEVDVAIVQAVEQDRPVTLRGVFYRTVSAGAVDKSEAGYRLVGRQLVKLRAAGKVAYADITDGTRLMRKPNTWTDLEEMLDTAAASYRRALWDAQPVEVIVLSEKDAISGAIYPVTAELDVELGITRGYSSVTFAHSIAETVIYNDAAGKVTYLYQLGDHDPSGVDGWRDFTVKVCAFAPGCAVQFERLAVTSEQIEALSLPTRPTKRTDTRAAGFTGESVEVDAIPASTLRGIVREAIEAHIDPHALELTRSVEASERDVLTSMIGGIR